MRRLYTHIYNKTQPFFTGCVLFCFERVKIVYIYLRSVFQYDPTVCFVNPFDVRTHGYIFSAGFKFILFEIRYRQPVLQRVFHYFLKSAVQLVFFIVRQLCFFICQTLRLVYLVTVASQRRERRKCAARSALDICACFFDT